MNLFTRMTLSLLNIIVLVPLVMIMKKLFIIRKDAKGNRKEGICNSPAMSYVAFITLALGYFGCIYTILVVSAANSGKEESIINEWVFEFFITFSMDTFFV